MRLTKLLPWLGLLVAVGLVYGGYRWQKAHAAPEIAWKTVPAEKRRIAAKVTASGTLQATVTVQVGAQVSGRIQKLNADYNTDVKKGQLLAKLDPQLFQAALEQANANFLSAKANVVKAEAQEKDAAMVLARAEKLAAENLASGSELQTAQTGLSVAKAGTEVAKATLAQATAAKNQASVNLSYTEIFSPIDGVVISRSVDTGQTVAASLQAPVLFTIAEDLRKMQVHTNVSEGDVGRLQTGMDATFTVDAFPGQIFKGKVGTIRNAAQTVQNVVTYDAVIDLDNLDLRLRPGMTATVTIAYAEKDEALAIPNAAFRFKPPPEIASVVASASNAPGGAGSGHAALHPPPAPGGSGEAHPEGAGSGARGRRPRPGGGGGDGPPGPGGTERRTVYVLRDGRAEAVRITTGLSDGTISEVVAGSIAPGDQVVTDVAVGGKPASSGPPQGGPPRMGRMF